MEKVGPTELVGKSKTLPMFFHRTEGLEDRVDEMQIPAESKLPHLCGVGHSG